MIRMTEVDGLKESLEQITKVFDTIFKWMEEIEKHLDKFEPPKGNEKCVNCKIF